MSAPITDKRCGTCRYFADEKSNAGDNSYCTYTITSHIPYWARYALETADDYVDLDSGKDCTAWERKP